jgi:hypothetical protein
MSTCCVASSRLPRLRSPTPERFVRLRLDSTKRRDPSSVFEYGESPPCIWQQQLEGRSRRLSHIVGALSRLMSLYPAPQRGRFFSESTSRCVTRCSGYRSRSLRLQSFVRWIPPEPKTLVHENAKPLRSHGPSSRRLERSAQTHDTRAFLGREYCSGPVFSCFGKAPK